jgi:hypothetical protein
MRVNADSMWRHQQITANISVIGKAIGVSANIKERWGWCSCLSMFFAVG